jgi:1-acyl-sn-glycerol-3-phosphate acyltransferase
LTRQYKPKAGFWIRLCVMVIYPLDALLFRIRWHHLDRMPEKGPVLIVINHVSQIDTLLMARLIWQSGRIPRFMIKSGVFQVAGLGNIMRGSKQIPVDRGTQEAARSLELAAEALNRGEAVIIYPEGSTTKDPDQWPMQAKTGLARLVQLAPHVPVVPIGQWGAQRYRLRDGTRLGRRPLRPLAQAILGEPMDMSAVAELPASQTTLRKVTDQIMTAVRDQVAELRHEPAPEAFFKPPRPVRPTSKRTPEVSSE